MKGTTTKTIYQMVISAMLIAVGLVLPLFLGQVQIFMQGISPMHIPAFIAGLTCGPVYGALVGFITPLLRMMTFGMPMPPVAIPMAFELAVYGAVTGILYPIFVCKVLPKNKASHLIGILLSMLVAMVGGRIVGGIAKAIFLGIQGTGYGFEAFVAAYVVGTAVGAVLHLIICPIVVLALEKVKLSPLAALMKTKR